MPSSIYDVAVGIVENKGDITTPESVPILPIGAGLYAMDLYPILEESDVSYVVRMTRNETKGPTGSGVDINGDKLKIEKIIGYFVFKDLDHACKVHAAFVGRDWQQIKTMFLEDYEQLLEAKAIHEETRSEVIPETEHTS